MARNALRSSLLVAAAASVSLFLATAVRAASQHSLHAMMPVGGGSPEVHDFKAAHSRMMRAMKLPFTGNSDVDFQMHMAPHHQGAIDMARIALRYARDPWTRQIAQSIMIAQQQEIEQFRLWLARHGARPPGPARPYYVISPDTYPDPEETSSEGGRPEELIGHTWAPGSGVPRVLAGGTATADSRGSTYAYKAAHDKMMRAMSIPYTGDPDVDFRTHMIPHHQGAIDMAKVELRYGLDPSVRQAAEAIIVAQGQEIYRFRAWLARHQPGAAPHR